MATAVAEGSSESQEDVIGIRVPVVDGKDSDLYPDSNWAIMSQEH